MKSRVPKSRKVVIFVDNPLASPNVPKKFQGEARVVELDMNKAKTARRVVEVLEFFDEQNRQATVMDIARRFNRPQSSTSELLAIMVNIGLLYKDRRSRTFRPTPRAAMLGSSFQPPIVRDGRLSTTMDQLSAETGHSVALIGMVGLKAQIFSGVPGRRLPAFKPRAFSGGSFIGLHESAAGWLLLSTMPARRSDAVLRQLRAEDTSDEAFNLSEIRERVRECGDRGYAVGRDGFQAGQNTCCVLCPTKPEEPPLTLGFVHSSIDITTQRALITALQRATQALMDRLNKVNSSNVFSYTCTNIQTSTFALPA